MNPDSYPTPFSTTSPQSNINSLPIVTTDFATESSPRDHTETQMALQRTSVALEAAYNRIRQLRRSISEVTDGTTSGERQSSPSVDDDNLSGLASSEVREPSSPASQHDSYVPLTPHLPAVRLPGSSRRRLNRDLPPLSTSIFARDAPPSNSSSSLTSQAPYPHLARSQLESLFQRRRESSSDDAATTLGRRVAAREAARTSTISSGWNNSSPMSRFEGYFAQLIATVEREFDYLRQQRSELSRTLATDNRPPLSRRTMELRRQLTAQSREGGSPTASSLVPQQDLFRRRLTGNVLQSRSSTTASRSERLSLLSNFSSVQNLPTPVSTGSSRLVLFEEPNSYLQDADDFGESRSDISLNEYGSETDRSHMVRRRFYADDQEHVHPIGLLDGFDEPLISIGRGERGVERGQSEVVSQRQRGWARLDHDGNEIPFEQEEELERARSEYRRRARSQNTFATTTDALTTSTSLIPEDYDGRQPRVRLSNFGSRQYHTIVNVDSKKSPEKGPVGPSKPFRPCPLPMPLEHMTWTPPSKHLNVNRVSKHASFAGR